MNEFIIKALRYVENTGGGATKENFIEDFEPIGADLWENIRSQSLVYIEVDGKIFLTTRGALVLLGAKP